MNMHDVKNRIKDIHRVEIASNGDDRHGSISKKKTQNIDCLFEISNQSKIRIIKQNLLFDKVYKKTINESFLLVYLQSSFLESIHDIELLFPLITLLLAIFSSPMINSVREKIIKKNEKRKNSLNAKILIINLESTTRKTLLINGLNFGSILFQIRNWLYSDSAMNLEHM